MSDFPFLPTDLQTRFDRAILASSLVVQNNAAFFLLQTDGNRKLAVIGHSNDEDIKSFHGARHVFDKDYTLYLCPMTSANTSALRAISSNLQPRPLGLTTSAGFGDRLGLATPGHVRALQQVLNSSGAGTTILPLFAQQSIREMTRTGRTPTQVLDDATWGAFEAGWRGPVGADADHLKNETDIDNCVAAGYSFYTFDPGAYVYNEADAASVAEIHRKVSGLPWQFLESLTEDLHTRYSGRTVDTGEGRIELTPEAILRAAAKYGGAVAQVVRQYRHLADKGVPFEVEVSVDETETPTTPAEHFYIASELKRLGVKWISLAPRFIGRFEKGVEYIGDLTQLRSDLAVHAAIARTLGPYKVSLHSGSDKFQVYPLITEATRGQVHLKTAGTSYLEALRTIAVVKPDLFRNILTLAVERFPTDRATYHVSAELSRVPAITTLPESNLADLLNQFDARQVLHVTFGSILNQFGDDLKLALAAYSAEYSDMLVRHFVRHLEPFLHARAETA